jgi:hypothetical protein
VKRSLHGNDDPVVAGPKAVDSGRATARRHKTEGESADASGGHLRLRARPDGLEE